MLFPPSVIARAMDAWRIRLWLTRGPRCPCGCSERVPWPAVKVEAFERRQHIPTLRSPCSVLLCIYDAEKQYIPDTLEGFKVYLKERRNVVNHFRNMLYWHCCGKDESWMCALLSYGHATRSWRTSKYSRYHAIQILFALVDKNWFAASDIVLSWTTVVHLLNEEDMMYLVKKPYRNGYEHMDGRLSVVQRNWLLHHPALAHVSHKARNHKYWTGILLWTVYVRSEMWAWKKARVPLPPPTKEAIPLFVKRINAGEYRLRPGTPFYQDMLNWIAFLAQESPATLREVLPKMGTTPQWLADVVETVAATGRVGRLHAAVRFFCRKAPMPFQLEKIWKWANDVAFATPCIARTILWYAMPVMNWAKLNNQKKGLKKRLLGGKAILRTMEANAVWLSNKLSDVGLVAMATDSREIKKISAALRGTPRFQKLQRIRTLQATVHLVVFFQKHVRTTKIKTVLRGDCPICWTPKILQALHSDTRHSICLPCTRKLKQKGMLDHCPLCRISLHPPPPPPVIRYYMDDDDGLYDDDEMYEDGFYIDDDGFPHQRIVDDDNY